MKFLLLLIIGGLLAVGNIRGQDISWVCSAPPETLSAGGNGQVWLSCLNGSSNSISPAFSGQFNGSLVAGNKTFFVQLKLTNPTASPAAIPPGGFTRRQYEFALPADVTGRATLQAGDFNPVLLQINGVAASVAAAAPTNSAPPVQKTFFTPGVSEFIGKHLSPYEPIYFLLGTYPAAEFQFSLKYQVINLDSAWNPLGHLYFAYTQTSFWDVLNQDPSFYDTSYKPSCFLFYTNVNRGDVWQLDLQGGVEHESNGRGGPQERALNTAYLQPTLHVMLPAQFEFDLQPRVWEYLSLNPNNPDLPEYRGYVDLRGSICRWTTGDDDRRMKQFELAARLRIGDHGEHAGCLIDFRYSLPVSWKINPAIDVQYFAGFGQTLRQYNQASDGLRAGFCLWY